MAGGDMPVLKRSGGRGGAEHAAGVMSQHFGNVAQGYGAGAQDPRASEGQINESRNRFLESMGADPMNLAEGAMGFLGQSAQGLSDMLMPDLMKGLQAARSRFGGGAIRSGGAQEGEENAFQRLYADPLQSRIAQLSTTALGYGQDEAQRGIDNAGTVLGFDENRFANRLGENNAMKRYNTGLAEERRQFDAGRKDKKRSGIGRFLGTVAGGVGGFMIGGPGGAFAGAKIGSNLGG